MAKKEPPEPPDVVGTREIAERLGVQHNTVTIWRKRGHLPEPQWFVSGNPAWLWPQIEAWARATGHGRLEAET